MEELREGWKRFKLGEIIELIGGGTPRTSVSEYWNGKIPWLSVKDFGSVNKFVEETEKTITELGLKESSTKILKKNDIIISARGTVGALAVLKREMAFNQSCYGIRGKSVVNNDFLYYLLKNTIEELKQNAYGSVFDTITTKTFDSIEIDLPPLEEQERIAEILSSLDDKIELNNQMNKTLEEMAQALFKEWFVDFNFPNENGEPYRDSGGEMGESELGMIPKGWRVGKLGDYGSIITGKTPSTKEEDYWGKEYQFITIPDMHNNMFILETSRYLTSKGNESQANKLLPKNAIIVSCIATVGLVSIVSSPAHTNQQINAIIYKKSEFREFLYLLLKEKSEHLNLLGSAGTTTKNVNKDTFEKMRVLIPQLNVINNFSKIVFSIFEKIQINSVETCNLIESKDLLNTKLLRGEI